MTLFVCHEWKTSTSLYKHVTNLSLIYSYSHFIKQKTPWIHNALINKIGIHSSLLTTIDEHLYTIKELLLDQELYVHMHAYWPLVVTHHPAVVSPQ